MKLTLIASAMPPSLDGIGDYTARLAAELAAQGHVVNVLTDNQKLHDVIPGVTVQGVFDPNVPASTKNLLDAIVNDPPDWVVLQYNPFGYGRRGLNLTLPRVMARVKQGSPKTRMAVMFHECYVPVIDLKFAVMATWQRWQFAKLGKSADALFFSINNWAEAHRSWFPGKPIHHLPVGANVPRVEIDRQVARECLGIAADDIVLGVFGSAHVARSFAPVRQSALQLQQAGLGVTVLYIGADGKVVREQLGDGIRLIADGPLAADEVSRRLSAADLALSTYVDGVSTRRGAMMAALQQGVAVVGTRGKNTDPELIAAHGNAVYLTSADDHAAFTTAVMELATNPELRQTIGRNGKALFDGRYAWPCVARNMCEVLAGVF